MIDRTPEWIARAAGGDLWVSEPRRASARREGPRRVTFDARKTGPGDLFCALLGGRTELRRQSAVAVRRGARGLLTSKDAAADLEPAQWTVIVVDDPLLGLQSLAYAWRQELGARVVAITGSCGKTSTKNILAPMLSRRWRVHASPGNYNNDIGVPVSILQAERGTDILVLEMALWSPDSVAALARIACPDVGVVLNVGPAHLDGFGGLEEVARAKAELIAELPAGAGCIVPANEPLLAPHLRDDLHTITFGPGGDVSLSHISDQVAEIDAAAERVQLELSYDQPTTCKTHSRQWPPHSPWAMCPKDAWRLISRPEGRDRTAERGSDVDQRLLQRQPTLGARRAR